MPMIGADLGAMTTLARRFSTAGSEFDAQATQITQQVDTALDEFTGEMSTLDREARLLAEAIDAEMGRLRTTADGTVWTGTHRAQQDAVVAALETDILHVRTAIDGFVQQAGNVVRGALTTTMTEMRNQVKTSGANARAVAESFGAGVETQRAAFDHVMNG